MKNGKAIGALVKGTACSLTALLAFACGNSQQGMMPTAAIIMNFGAKMELGCLFETL